MYVTPLEKTTTSSESKAACIEGNQKRRRFVPLPRAFENHCVSLAVDWLVSKPLSH